MKISWSVKLIDDPYEVLNYLQVGINIPVLEEFKEFILYDLNAFPSKSLLIMENDKITGHMLLFHDDSDTLYFGFFGTINIDKDLVEFMIQYLKDYAKENHFHYIRGPINIPTIIYGWGFMGKNSIERQHRAKPVTPPLYLEMFLEHNFYIKTEEVSWEGDISQVDLNQYNVSDETLDNFDLIDLQSWEDLDKYTTTILRLNKENMPSESILTPSLERVVMNYMNFFRHFGDFYMVTFVQEKRTEKVVGYISCLPDPFDNEAFCIFTLVIDKEYRSKGLAWYLTRRALEKVRAHNLCYMSAPIEKNNKITQLMCKSLGLQLLRSHIIVECKI
ncbi:MAG: GNAT family N-acetyltransferase [Promethearchaeota archaeon]